MLGDRGLDLVELPEAVTQTELGLHPRHCRVLQPVEDLRCQLIELQQLLGQQRHQYQQQCHQNDSEHGKDRNHTPGS